MSAALRGWGQAVLRRISTKDFSLLRAVEVTLGNGLTVITGASGSGKTLLFDAVAFALGSRAHRNLLPEGAKSCEVTLELELSAADATSLGDPWQAGTNSVTRRYSASGSGRISVNGATASAAQLQPVAETLFEITGQFESRVLFEPRSHLALLESFGDAKLTKARAAYEQAWKRYSRLATALETARESEAGRTQELDFLQFQVAELEKSAVQPGERARVEADLRLQQNAQALVAAATEASRQLSGEPDDPGAYDLTARALARMDELAELLNGTQAEGFDAETAVEQGRDLLERLRDLAELLRDFAGAVQYEPAQEAVLTERIDEILRLERKYAVPADELEGLLVGKQQRLEALADASQSPEALERELAELQQQLKALAAELTTQRKVAAKRLLKATHSYLRRLDFPDVQFEVELGPAGKFRPDGADSAEFLVSLNPGEPPRALAQVASGGEASRLFLGLKAALAERLSTRVMLLDEIEAGLGGDTARKVADVLAELATTRQILAITHLPTVAIRGTSHLLVSKGVERGRSMVRIEPADGETRRAELLRMLGGDDSAEARALVEQMLAR